MTHDPERLARAALTRALESGARLPAELRTLTAVELWDALLRNPFDGPVASRASETVPERDLERIAAAGGRFVIPGDDDWPTQLEALEAASLDGAASPSDSAGVPYGLWVRGVGPLGEVTKRSVAIIGSRASSSYGDYVASEFAAGLVADGYTVVSGGAYGIDASAHQGALARGGGITVAVVACGVDLAYPRRNEAMFARILDNGGVIVSEVPPGATPMRQRFLMRNRIVAALSQATVVVEAGQRSGTFNTVRWTERIKHPVLAVPGPVTATTSSGPNELIRTGRAKAVRSVADVLEDLGSSLRV